MTWLREILSERDNRLSSKRVAMMIATLTLAVSTLILSSAALYGWDVAAALGAVSIPLAGLGGFTYIGGKYAERTPPYRKEREESRTGKWTF